MKKYTKSEILEKLVFISGWDFKDSYITKTFVFRDFSETFGFMSRVALLAETDEHHPDWSGKYNMVTIKLKTHEVEGITDKDFSFATKIEKLI